jgi:hypothetical protein
MDSQKVAEDRRGIRQVLEVTVELFDPGRKEMVILIDEVDRVAGGGTKPCLASRPDTTVGIVPH